MSKTLSQITTALESDKTAIRQAILSGGGTCPEGHGFDDFASDIGSIPTSTWEDITSEIKLHQAGFTLSSAYCYYNSSKKALILSATFSGRSSSTFQLNYDLLIPVLEIPRSSSISTEIIPTLSVGAMSIEGSSANFNLVGLDSVQQSTSSYGTATIAHITSSFSTNYPSSYSGGNPYIKTYTTTSKSYLCAVRWSKLAELLNTDNTIICAYVGASSYSSQQVDLYSDWNQTRGSHTIKYCNFNVS